LEYLPLALEQAAAYVGAQPPGWGFAEYLRLYEANERAFLTKKTPGATEYPDSVYLTWRATIDKLPQGARAILRLHCFLASTPTPVAMFVRGVDQIVEAAKLIAGEIVAPLDEDIEGAGEFAVREWVSALAKYSMAQFQAEDSFSVHGLCACGGVARNGGTEGGCSRTNNEPFSRFCRVSVMGAGKPPVVGCAAAPRNAAERRT
jgi:hypothetical protein